MGVMNLFCSAMCAWEWCEAVGSGAGGLVPAALSKEFRNGGLSSWEMGVGLAESARLGRVGVGIGGWVPIYGHAGQRLYRQWRSDELRGA